MPQQQPQLDPSYDYMALPDGSYAQFPKGTSEAEMRQKIVARGLVKQQQAAPAAPVVAKPAARPMTAPVAKPSFGKRYAQTMMIPTTKEEAKQAAIGASGLGTTYQIGKGIYEGGKAAVEDVRTGHPGRAALDILPALAPFPAMVGTNIGTDVVTKNIKGLLGTGAGLVTQAMLARGGESVVDPSKNLKAIEKLNQTGLKMAEDGVVDPTKVSAVRVAREQIHGNMESVQRQIQEHITAKEAPKEAAIQQAVARGATLGPQVAADVVRIENNVRQIGARRGTLTQSQIAALQNFLKQLMFKPDPQTGALTTPRNWQNLPIREAWDLTRTKGLLSEEADFPSDTPDIVKVAARQIRGVVVDRIGEAAPDAQRLAREQSELVRARDAIGKNVESSRKGTLSTFRGIMNSGAPMLAAWIGLRELGLPSTVALGSVLLFKALAESTPSRTLRAAWRAKFLEWQERALATAPQAQPPQAGGPPLPQGGGGAPAGGPSVAPRPQLPAAPAALPPASRPTAPAATTTPSGRSVTAAELAVQAQPGTRGIASDITKWQPPPELGVSSVGDIEKRVAANRAKMGEPPRSGQSGAKPTTTSTPPEANRRVGESVEDWVERTKDFFPDVKPKTHEALGNKTLHDYLKPYFSGGAARLDTLVKDLRSRGFVHEKTTKGRYDQSANARFVHPNGESITVGVNPDLTVNGGTYGHGNKLEPIEPRTKRTYDYKAIHDTLVSERVGQTKSAMETAQVNKMIAEVQRAMSGKATPAELSLINKHIRERGYTQAARSKAAATVQPAPMSAGEPVSQGLSPEQRVLLVDQGYKAIIDQYGEGGKEAVKQMKAMAKAAEKVKDPSYDELEKITEVLEALKQIPKGEE